MCLAIPGRLVSADSPEDPLQRTGQIEFGGVRKSISLAYAPAAQIDDYVLVHAGFAIEVIDAEEAERTLGYLKEMGELLEEESSA
jgi:hydrogenase expression/formation protein HypC